MPLFVGIAGPSGAGKTTLAQHLLDRLPGEAALFALDWYYNDLAAVPLEERGTTNFDHPEAIDWERFFDDFMLLESGEAAQAPVYDFSQHARLPETRTIAPLPVVIVEGLHVLWQPALRAMLNFRIYVDAQQTTCLKRRVERDTAERGRSSAEVVRQYRAYTNPMFLQFVAPSKDFAELIINGEEDFAHEADKLAQRLM